MFFTVINQARWFWKVAFLSSVWNTSFYLASGMPNPTFSVRNTSQITTLIQSGSFVLHTFAFIALRSKFLTGQSNPFSWPCRWISRSPEELGERLLQQFIGNTSLLMTSLLWMILLGQAIWDSQMLLVKEAMEAFRVGRGQEAVGAIVGLLPVYLFLVLWLLFLLSLWYIAIVTSIQDWMEVGAPEETLQDWRGPLELVRAMAAQAFIQEQIALLLRDMNTRLREVEERLMHLEQEQ